MNRTRTAAPRSLLVVAALFLASILVPSPAATLRVVTMPTDVEPAAYDGTPASLRKICSAFTPAAKEGHAVAVYICREALLAQGRSPRETDRLFPKESVSKKIPDLVAETWYLWLMEQAESGDAFYQKVLGYFYEYGVQEQKDSRQAVQWYRRSADGGYLRAQWLLGRCYANGRGIAKDVTKAIVLFEAAADKGCTETMCELGDLYLRGRAVALDYDKALDWYQKALDAGNKGAKDGLARARRGKARWLEAARKLPGLESAAEQGAEDAQYELGRMYCSGMGVAKDEAQGYAWYRRAAEQGNRRACRIMASRYSEGHGVPKDSAQHLYWFTKAAEAGDSYAQNKLASMYERGRGVKKDYALARKWYMRAASENKRGGAMRALGDMYREGRGVPKDPGAAIRWYRKSAQEGTGLNIESMMILGDMYAAGEGVEPDARLALKWYGKAADVRHEVPGMPKYSSMSLAKIATLYERGGPGLEPDTVKAVNWLYTAAKSRSSRALKDLTARAEAGSPAAQFYMGELHYYGIQRRTEPDYGEAAYWYMEAAERGHRTAELFLDFLRFYGPATEEQLADAARRAR